jgi:hypothetical protein
MMQKSTTFTTIFRVKKCYFHYDMQKIICHNSSVYLVCFNNLLKVYIH